MVSFGSSFVDACRLINPLYISSPMLTPSSQAAIASSEPTVPVEDAIKTAEAALGASVNDHPASLEYLALADGSVALTHVVQVQDEEKGIWVEAFVDAHTNELISIVNFVTKLTVSLCLSVR